jgi:hypothetical protein
MSPAAAGKPSGSKSASRPRGEKNPKERVIDDCARVGWAIAFTKRASERGRQIDKRDADQRRRHKLDQDEHPENTSNARRSKEVLYEPGNNC